MRRNLYQISISHAARGRALHSAHGLTGCHVYFSASLFFGRMTHYLHTEGFVSSVFLTPALQQSFPRSLSR